MDRSAQEPVDAQKSTFFCPEIDEFVNDELSTCSNRLTRLLIDANERSWDATDARIDAFEIFTDVNC